MEQKHKQLIKETISRETKAIHLKTIYGTKHTNNLSKKKFQAKHKQFIKKRFMEQNTQTT